MTFFFILILIFLSILVLFLSAEVISAIYVRPRIIKNMAFETDVSFVLAVLVPAHDEEDVIQATLRQIKQQLRACDRLVVVADNCTDETISIARENDAEVVQRQDEQKKGKGYALDCGIQFLKRNPPDVVVIMDADVQVAPGTIRLISTLAYRCKKPIQARYLLNIPCGTNSKSSISAFAFLFKNFIRPQGLSRLRGGCLLTGTGMAFAWDVIKDAELASCNIVEDMQLGIDLAIAGATPMYCQEALVTSEMAPTGNAAKAQRTRWEHGHLITMFTQTGRLFREAAIQRRLDLVLLGLEVSIPPLSSFVLLLGLGSFFSFILSFFEVISFEIFLWFCFLFVILIFNVLIAWFFFGRDIVSMRHFISAPAYIFWKIPIYTKILFRRVSKWTKTDRIKQ